MRTRALAAGSALYLGLALTAVSAGGEDGVTLTVAGRSAQTPWAATLGNVVVVAFGTQAPPSGADVFVAVSRDGGGRFDAPVRVNAEEGSARLGGELPPRVGLVARPGSDPEIVVAFGAKSTAGNGAAGRGATPRGGASVPPTTEILVARSRDGGRTFDAPRALQAAGAPGDRGWHAMALDATGTAHVFWLDHRGLAKPQSAAAADHGAAAHKAAEQDALDGVAMAQKSGLHYARDGAHASAERVLVNGVCYCCKVAVAATPNGGLVAAWRHVYPGNIRDIAVIDSRDGGRTFGQPGRVSTDDWHLAGCPDDGPAIAAAGNGRTHLVWPTVVGGAEGAIFYSSSDDGRAFAPRVRVPTLGSPRPMHPQVVVAAPDHGFVAWDEVVGGIRQAAVRPIRFGAGGRPSFGEARRLGRPDVPTSYPMVVVTPSGPLAVFVEGAAGTSVLRVRPLAPRAP